jgi:GT2 family glycosyltransferase
MKVDGVARGAVRASSGIVDEIRGPPRGDRRTMERNLREIAIAVPSLDQGRFLHAALSSVLSQAGVTTRVAVIDGGSTDGTADVLSGFRDRLAWCRMAPDDGQTAAINEGIERLVDLFPQILYVGWLNADDVIMPGGLRALADAMDVNPSWAAVAGRAQLIADSGDVVAEIPTARFDAAVFGRMCTISQPGTLVRRTAWQAVGGLDTQLNMAFDYDLWWRIAGHGPIGYLEGAVVAASRDHEATKTRTRRAEYFREGMQVVRRHTGRVPWHWCISEALEREAGWRLGSRSGPGARMRAGGRALASYLRWNLAGGRPA